MSRSIPWLAFSRDHNHLAQGVGLMMKKRFYLVMIAFTAVLALVGCNNAPTSPAAFVSQDVKVTTPVAAAVLAQDYAGAVSARSQLVIGTFRLEETSLAIAPEQAKQLLPLWQMLRALTASGTASEAETEAVLRQIQQVMTVEQIQAIRGMRLTSNDNQVLMESLGVVPQNAAAMQSGAGSSLSDAEKATRRAERMSSADASTGGRVVLDKLIELLERKL